MANPLGNPTTLRKCRRDRIWFNTTSIAGSGMGKCDHVGQTRFRISVPRCLAAMFSHFRANRRRLGHVAATRPQFRQP